MLTQRETHLKVKHLSLAQEMRIIRRLEVSKRKTLKRPNPNYSRPFPDVVIKGVRQFIKKPNRNFDTAGRESLRDHRLNLKPLARALHLARGYLQGMPYRVMERMAYESPDWKLVWDHVVRFGNRNLSAASDESEERVKFMAWADTVLPQDPARLSNRSGEGDYANTKYRTLTPSYFIKLHNRW